MKWIFEVDAPSIDCIHLSRARRWKSSPLKKRDHALNEKNPPSPSAKIRNHELYFSILDAGEARSLLKNK
jgi:hypothetical protein